MKLLVTGATGFIGRNFLVHALAEGYSVRALVRTGREDNLPQAVEIVYGSLPYDIPPGVFKDVSAIVHCAAVTTSDKATESFSINLEGTRYLLEMAKVAGVSQFVFLSTQSAHDESISAYGKSKLAAEKVLRESGMRYKIIRPGLVYGPGKTGLFARMVETVGKFPILPLLDGGKVPVQPIEVSDLCRVIVNSLSLQENAELNVGSETPIALADFLREVSLAFHNKNKPALSVPVWPLLIVAGIGEKLKLKLPISTDNLKGLRTVKIMDTAPSFKKIGITLVSLKEGLKKAAESENFENLANESQKKIALIGAGKVGILHAMNLRHRESVKLTALIDQNPKAPNLYRSLGFAVNHVATIDDMRETCDGAIIATPAFTHFSLAEKCCEKNIPLMVEKPLCIKGGDSDRWRNLEKRYPRAIIHTGYMMTQMPHLAAVEKWLAEKRIGAVTGGTALAMQSHIMGPKPVRWEMKKDLAGGGAVINFGCHVLSVLFRIFGVPETQSPFAWSIYCQDVEDAAGALLQFKDFSVNYFTSWSAPNYPKPDNRIIFYGEKGRIEFSNSFSALFIDENPVEVLTQGDYDVGFNIAPDYTGGGFANEHRNFLHSLGAGDEAKSPLPKPVLLAEALRLEEWIHRFYDNTPLVKPSAPPEWITGDKMLIKAWENLERGE